MLACKIHTILFIVFLLKIVPPGKCDLFPNTVKNFNLLRFWLGETGLLKQTLSRPRDVVGLVLDDIR